MEAPAGAAGSRRYGIAALALAVVVGLLLGYASGWLAPKLAQPGESSVEAGFARDMSTHHAQAVELGLIAFQRASDAEVRQVGMDIATMQQGDIGALALLLRQWRLDPTGSQPQMAWMPGGSMLEHGLMPGMATPEQMTRLRNATGEELDVLFCQLMLRHHLGGIHMVDELLRSSGNADLRALAETMKAGQVKELAELHRLLERLGAKPL